MNLDAAINEFSTFLIGIVMVFVALLIIIGFIKVVSIVVTNIEKKTAPKTEVKPAPVVKAVEPVVVTSVVALQDELELVAVITAVIAASLGTTSDKLQVRSLRQVNRRVR